MSATQTTGSSSSSNNLNDLDFDTFLIDPELLALDAARGYPATTNTQSTFLRTPEATPETASEVVPNYEFNLELAEMLDNHPEAFALSSDDEDAKRLACRSRVSGKPAKIHINGEGDFVAFNDLEVFSLEKNARRQAAKLTNVSFAPGNKKHEVNTSFDESTESCIITVADKSKSVAAVQAADNTQRSKRKFTEIESSSEESDAEEEIRRRSKRRRTRDDRMILKPRKEKRGKASRTNRRFARVVFVESETETSDEEYDDDSEEDSDEDFRPRSKRSRISRTSGTRSAAKRVSKKNKSVKSAAETSELQQPLSEIMLHIPLLDIDAFVNRPSTTRQKEVEYGTKNPGKVGRPMNAFILYRKTFQHRCKEFARKNNHQMVSKIAGKSWDIETDAVKKRFLSLQRLEVKNHEKAWPDYRFRPGRPARAMDQVD